MQQRESPKQKRGRSRLLSHRSERKYRLGVRAAFVQLSSDVLEDAYASNQAGAGAAGGARERLTPLEGSPPLPGGCGVHAGPA
jgi:hypothetical protein